jgi:DNA gyrase subunit A
MGVTLFRVDAGEHVTSVFPVVDDGTDEIESPLAGGATGDNPVGDNPAVDKPDGDTGGDLSGDEAGTEDGNDA